MTANDADALESLLRLRHSTRAFDETEVPHAVQTRILEMAQRTGTWCNAQPWHVRILSGAELRELAGHVRAAVEQRRDRGFEITPPLAYEGRYADRRRTCAAAMYEAIGITREDRTARYTQAMKNYDFFDAPHAAFLTAEVALGDYALVDVGAYMSTFALAAASLGVATVVQGAVAEYSPVIREHLDLPVTERIVASIAFGYEDRDDPVNSFRTERATLDHIVEWH